MSDTEHPYRPLTVEVTPEVHWYEQKRFCGLMISEVLLLGVDLTSTPRAEQHWQMFTQELGDNERATIKLDITHGTAVHPNCRERALEIVNMTLEFARLRKAHEEVLKHLEIVDSILRKVLK